MNRFVIFDFDGVLVNTEYTTFSFYKDLLPKYNIHLKEEDFKHKAGRKSHDSFKFVLRDKYDEKIVDELVELKREAFIKDVKKYLKPLPGVFDLLESCKKAGLKMGIGSQNEKPLIQKALDVFGFRDYFEFTTALQDLSNKKPHPEVFLLVADTVGILPEESVVIEDAPIGIEAAIEGGFKSIGITTSFTKEDLNKADLVIDSLSELDGEKLKVFKQ